MLFASDVVAPVGRDALHLAYPREGWTQLLMHSNTPCILRIPAALPHCDSATQANPTFCMYAMWRLTSAVNTLELMHCSACMQQSKAVLGSPCNWKGARARSGNHIARWQCCPSDDIVTPRLVTALQQNAQGMHVTSEAMLMAHVSALEYGHINS